MHDASVTLKYSEYISGSVPQPKVDSSAVIVEDLWCAQCVFEFSFIYLNLSFFGQMRLISIDGFSGRSQSCVA